MRFTKNINCFDKRNQLFVPFFYWLSFSFFSFAFLRTTFATAASEFILRQTHLLPPVFASARASLIYRNLSASPKGALKIVHWYWPVRPRFLIRHFIFIIPPLPDMGSVIEAKEWRRREKPTTHRRRSRNDTDRAEHIRSAIDEVCLAQCVHNCMTWQIIVRGARQIYLERGWVHTKEPIHHGTE